MSKVLVTYATMAGSTAEVASFVGEKIALVGAEVEVLPLETVKDLSGYDAVVIGAPMIMGWHRAAQGFMKKHRQSLQQIPFAVFVMAMSLTETGEGSVGGLPVCVDKKLPKPPVKAGSLTFRERYARLSNYVQPVLNTTRPAKPASLAVFGGRLEYGRLKWWAVLFAMLIIQAPARDLRDWESIQSWAAGLPSALNLSN